uniref:Uncharacterized protein n=1 Tax=Gasterosteus aculeatus aculeatus TaxID=481459 RepID=A0AAQ4PFJ4_GASAC
GGPPRSWKYVVHQLSVSLEEMYKGGSRNCEVVNSMEKRKEFCIKPVHAAAYMLDPKRYLW